jgi:hypothetical protein
MIISASGGKKEYAPCPEYTGKAVCVDVTPLKEYETEYGTKKKLKFAFEIDLIDDTRDPVQPWVVFTKPMVPSLHEKAALTKFLKDWFGRKLTDHENKALDLESLIGKSCSIVIAHEESQDGTKVYANIKLIMPLKSGELKPSGLWVRLQDRPPKDETGKTPLPSSPSNAAPRQETDILKTQVHVGKFRGVPLCDLNDVAVQQLAEHWIPKAMAAETISPADKQLIKAINARLEAIKAANKEIPLDDVPF